jgi:hypothetical protein
VATPRAPHPCWLRVDERKLFAHRVAVDGWSGRCRCGSRGVRVIGETAAWAEAHIVESLDGRSDRHRTPITSGASVVNTSAWLFVGVALPLFVVAGIVVYRRMRRHDQENALAFTTATQEDIARRGAKPRSK